MELQDKIRGALGKKNKKPIGFKELLARTGLPKGRQSALAEALEQMKASGEVFEQRHKLMLSEAAGLVKGRIVRVNDTFGFARPEGAEADAFIPGRMLLGAMPDDTVLLRLKDAGGQLLEGEVVSILNRAEYRFSGVVSRKQGRYTVTPDRGVRFPIDVSRLQGLEAKDGEKVVARLSHRGERHLAHRAEVLGVYGTADSAQNCCAAILEAAEIPREFPGPVMDEARAIQSRGITPKELEGRLDLRDLIIFTIDGADSKDMDDAISLERTSAGWKLGVHIADVSHYVREGTELDREAFRRGTSVYYADSVVPMLPEALSNDLCSLNPGTDRLAFSGFVELDAEGAMRGFSFRKTVIHSRVKGVYSEVNRILDGSADKTVRDKYRGLEEQIHLMDELAGILSRRRFGRGALDLESTESKIDVGPDGVAVGVRPRERGVSERIIEEFMLAANEAAATFAMDRALPFVYRVHEKPSPEKLEALAELLDALGVGGAAQVKPGVATGTLAGILNQVRDTRNQSVVNNTILRSMAKARYYEKNLGHYGLVLQNYTHFTSPIRRYPDLAIHRVMTAVLAGTGEDKLEKRFREFVSLASARSSEREQKAMNAERDCESCYKAEYMKAFVGRRFEGVISAVAPHGLYVELENTVEGLVRADSLTGDEFLYDGRMQFSGRNTGRRYRVGDAVSVVLLSADVPSGQIDFKLEQPEA
jgi:ribonuclease R